jgi:glycine betaine/proline transport system ATP-binding protein
MDRADQSSDSSIPVLKSGTTLESAAKQLAKTTFDTATVVDHTSRNIGKVSLRQISSAITAAGEEEGPKS